MIVCSSRATIFAHQIYSQTIQSTPCSLKGRVVLTVNWKLIQKKISKSAQPPITLSGASSVLSRCHLKHSLQHRDFYLTLTVLECCTIDLKYAQLSKIETHWMLTQKLVVTQFLQLWINQQVQSKMILMRLATGLLDPNEISGFQMPVS